MFKQITDALLCLLFPKTCSGCENILLTNETVICTVCRHELPFTLHEQLPENEITRRFYGRIPVHHASSIFYFQKKGITQKIIHALKYEGNQEIGTFFGDYYGVKIKDKKWTDDVDLILPVPLHPKKKSERGYNQISTFGEALSKHLQKPFREDILIRTQYSKTQSKNNLSKRNEVTSSVFNLNNHENLKGVHFLLIDDVVTSGATLEACSNVLLTLPDAKISIITLAYAQW